MLLNDILTPEQVRELIDYDPETGILTWRARKLRVGLERIDKGWNTRFTGKRAGRPDRNGHIWVGIAYEELKTSNFAAHRLAWAHYYGEWPNTGIDHINRNSSDNRIANLRLADQTRNSQNSSLRSDNTSGVKGVYWVSKEQKWAAFININKKVTQLGRYESKEEAIRVRQDAAKRYFGEFANETVLEG